ncbi:MAG: glycosyltransferase family 4 protein [Actinomycetota bacterium]
MSDVTVVTQFYYPEKIGTAFYTRDLVQAICEREGLSVQVVTGEPYYPQFAKYPGYEKAAGSEIIDGVSVHRLRTYVPRPGSAIARIVSELNFLVRGRWALARKRIPRTRYVISFAPGMFPVLLGKALTASGGRHLTIVHDLSSGLARGTGLVPNRAAGRAMERVEAWVLNRPDSLAVLSPQMSGVLRAMGVACPIEVVPLWVRDILAGREPAASPEEPTVMYSGSLGRKQGVHRLLALARRLNETMPEARMIVRGQGSMESRVRAEAVGLPNIEFHGLVADEDLARSLGYGRVHLVLQDPDSANFSVPSKVFSTLAAGRRVGATARPGTPLHDLSRLCPALTCVDPDDPEALLFEVQRLLSQRSLCESYGRMGREFVLRNHVRDEVVGRLLNRLTGTPEEGRLSTMPA